MEAKDVQGFAENEKGKQKIQENEKDFNRGAEQTKRSVTRLWRGGRQRRELE